MTLISLIIKSYLSILISVGVGSLFIFILGLYFILRTTNFSRVHPVPLIHPSEGVSTEEDVAAIAGEDVISTQLDLARAYLETGQLQSAKYILQLVLTQGNSMQRMEAENLLRVINSCALF